MIRKPIKPKHCRPPQHDPASQAWVSSKLMVQGVPVPRVFEISIEDDYLVEEYIEGYDMDDPKISLSNTQV